jgi:N-acetylated-alpha-linked acidic dipeptidase
MNLAPMLSELSNQVDGRRLMAHLTEFARWTKHAGTKTELASLDYVKATLDSNGYATELILHDAYISLPGAAHIEVAGERFACITQSFSRSSPPDGLRGTAIAAGAGAPRDFTGDVAGKIVLLDGIATPAVSQRAGAAGAIGQIHFSPSEYAHEMCISPVWGSPTHQTVSKLPSTVVVTVARKEGVRLRAALAKKPNAVVTLQAEVDTGWRSTPILVASLDPKGAAQDVPYVMFSGHHDTWYYGVMDNGGANAVMLEVARLCAGRIDDWRRGLRLMFWSGHSQGRYSSSTWYADTHWDELERRAVAHVNIDSTAARGNVVLEDCQAAAELLGVAREAIRVEGGQPLTGHRVGRAGDQSFWGIGVPAIFAALGEQPAEGSASPASFLFGGPNKKGAGTGWWWHTPADTLDKMDEEIAIRDARVYLHVVATLLASPVLPIDYGEHAAMLLRELDQLRDKLGDRFDLSPLRAEVTRLREAAIALRRGADAAASEHEMATINRCIMALSRALVPMDYTLGDRFDHDPALAQPAYPALTPLRELAASEAKSDQAKFIAVAAQRSVNRVARAVRDANAAIEACFNALLLRSNEGSGS